MTRKFAEILEEITVCEQAIALTSVRLAVLRQEAMDHPDAAAGKDLPPINGTIGG